MILSHFQSQLFCQDVSFALNVIQIKPTLSAAFRLKRAGMEAGKRLSRDQMHIMDNLLGSGDGAVLPFISKARTSSNSFLIERKWVLVACAGSACSAALPEAIRGPSAVNPSFSAMSLQRASRFAGLPA